MRTQIHWSRAIVAAIVVTLLGAACTKSGVESGTGERAAAGGNTTIAVSLKEFSITPAQIDAPSGQVLTFDVTNNGTTQHTFAVDTGNGVRATQLIDPGASATLEVPALGAGTYRVYCTVPGHADLGMEGQLVVAGAGSGSPSGGMNMGSPGGMNMGSSGTMTAEEMAQSHKAGVEAFPAKTQGTGNVPLRPTMQNGWKVFELTASEVRWEVLPGQFVDAMAYNGQIPGPEIRVQQGDKVRVVVNNQMSQPTTVHFHGMTVPNKSDGVPYITQDPIMPGGYYVYEFTVVDPPGMYVYHSHFNSTEQVGKGLYGAIIVEPKDGAWSYPEIHLDPQTGQVTGYGAPPKIDVETTLFLGDGPLGYVLNAKSFPATQPIVANRGDWVLIHMANDGSMLHPMHMHGYHFEVVAQDGFPLKDPYMADTLVVAPGQRFDVLVHAIYPGVWAFHCHILPHVEGPQGMYGMVTALVVQ
jgi:FtsP/CotA-like multicopper oxidase with cupredoxin domain